MPFLYLLLASDGIDGIPVDFVIGEHLEAILFREPGDEAALMLTHTLCDIVRDADVECPARFVGHYVNVVVSIHTAIIAQRNKEKLKTGSVGPRLRGDDRGGKHRGKANEGGMTEGNGAEQKQMDAG